MSVDRNPPTPWRGWLDVYRNHLLVQGSPARIKMRLTILRQIHQEAEATFDAAVQMTKQAAEQGRPAGEEPP